MRKRIVWCIFIMIVISGSLRAQLNDHVWTIGSSVTTMSFDGDSVILGRLADTTVKSFVTISNICDSDGRLLFFTNGINLYNRLGGIMLGGDSLSYPSQYYDQVVSDGMPSWQGALILPQPNTPGIYYLFHYSAADTNINSAFYSGGYEATSFYYSVIDMNGDSGNGVVVRKNVPIIQDEVLSASRLSACRHANGRDWWIIKNAWWGGIYYKFLLTPDGLLGPYTQVMGSAYANASELPGYAAFSPDGTKYASITCYSKLKVMDFDRCTGSLSNQTEFYNSNSTDPVHFPNTGGTSIAFSPSGRFLYVNNTLELNQYDLWSSNTHDSIRIKTDTMENYLMNILQLAPNGKMYVSCWNGGSYQLHVINNPDSLGLSCGFQMFAQNTLSPNSVSLPYFPNFRLGALSGACDTIHTDIADIAEAHPAFAAVTPNPASDHAVLIWYTNHITQGKAELFDASGKVVWRAELHINQGNMLLNLQSLSAGVFVVRVETDNKELLRTNIVLTK